MNTLQRFDHWHQTRGGLLIFGIAEILLAYAVGSRAIDTGSLWQYALAILGIVGALQNLLKIMKVNTATSR